MVFHKTVQLKPGQVAEALADQGPAPFCFYQTFGLGGTLKIISLIELGQVDKIDLIVDLVI